MSDIENDVSRNQRRTLAVIVGICGLATLTLLANHPSPHAHTFPDLLKAEAHNQLPDALVHGGFIVTTSILIICFTILARYLGQRRIPVVIGYVAFCLGSGVVIASMVVDGLVLPAIAARYAESTTPEEIASAHTIFVFGGTLVRFLLPIAIVFNALSMAGFSLAIKSCGVFNRAVAVYGISAAILICGAIFFVPPRMAEHALLISIVLQGIWYVAIGAAFVKPDTVEEFQGA